MTTKRNVVSWVESWNRKRTLGKNYGSVNKLRTGSNIGALV